MDYFSKDLHQLLSLGDLNMVKMKPDIEDNATVARGNNTLRNFAHKEEFKDSGAEKRYSCDETLVTRPEVKQHSQSILSKNFNMTEIKCASCDKTFKKLRYLRMHTKNVHEKSKQYNTFGYLSKRKHMKQKMLFIN